MIVREECRVTEREKPKVTQVWIPVGPLMELENQEESILDFLQG